MNRFNTIISQVIIVLSLLLFPLTETYAKAGCCSSHGGVAGCNSATGHQLCKDGTDSPSCACNGTTSKPTKATKKAQPVQQQTPANTSSTAQPAAAASATKTKGCCSRHGGVGQCNKSTGYFTCKDGTQSTSCKCS